ncbi:MAG TPA: hypothetical protein V6D46_02540 [Coleofasciculaceae cyanobacterium]
MSQTELLLLARQGNVEAIATLMNRKLQTAGIAVDVNLDGNCLILNLVGADHPPDRPALMTFVRKGMNILKVDSVGVVRVSGWAAGSNSPAWTDALYLASDGSGMSLAAPPLSALGLANGPSYTISASGSPPPTREGSEAYGESYSSEYGSIAPEPAPSAAPVAPAPVLPVFSTEDSYPIADEAIELIQPEKVYEAWLAETGQLGFPVQGAVPKLAEFLVYFLNAPEEQLIDVTAVRIDDQPTALLLTNTRLCAITLPTLWSQRAVRELAALPYAAISRVGLAREGLAIDTTAGDRFLAYFSNPVLGDAFVNRSLVRFCPVEADPNLPSQRDERSILFYGLAILGVVYGLIFVLHWIFGSSK